MGCIEQREKDDYIIQAKEAQLQIFLFTIDHIRNGFFYLNDGDNISEEHLNTGYSNMSNMATNFLSKYTDSDKAFKKFIVPFKQIDGMYQYREILSCLYLNSKNKSVEKARAIVEIFKKDQETLNLEDIKEIFQRMFKSVFLYSQSLIDNYLVPVQQVPLEENSKQKLVIEEEKKQEEKIEEKIEEKKEEKTEDKTVKEENKELKTEEEKKEEIKVYNQKIEEYLKLGENIANNIAESFLTSPDLKITIDEFAEKCKSHVPAKFKRDIMSPKGIRLCVYQEYDKQKQEQQQQQLQQQLLEQQQLENKQEQQ